MDMLDYVEREATRTQEHLMSAYATSHERVYKVLTLLLAGAGALGAYVLDQIGTKQPAYLWVPLGSTALWWFLISSFLLVQALQSQLLGIGATPRTLLERYVAEGGNGSQPWRDSEAEILRDKVRLAELVRQQERIQSYAAAIAQRSKATDLTYRAAALTPAIPIAVYKLMQNYGYI